MEPRHHPLLYIGQVHHARLLPKHHSFRYRIFYVALNLKAFAQAEPQKTGLALNKKGWASLYERDYGAQTQRGLEDHIKTQFQEAGLSTPIADIVLITLPRIWGYAFNPISLFYAYGPKGDLLGICYEVHNTFGERHDYIVLTDQAATRHEHDTMKAFYVSPFFDVDGSYHFKAQNPDEQLYLHIDYKNPQRDKQFTATLRAKAQPLTQKALRKVLWAIPFVTLKTIAAIHFEALRLWLKGVKLTKKPPPPPDRVTALPRQTASKRGETGPTPPFRANLPQS